MQSIYNLCFPVGKYTHMKAESLLSLILLNVDIFVITKLLLLLLLTRNESHHDNLDYFVYFNNKWVV